LTVYSSSSKAGKSTWVAGWLRLSWLLESYSLHLTTVGHFGLFRQFAQIAYFGVANFLNNLHSIHNDSFEQSYILSTHLEILFTFASFSSSFVVFFRFVEAQISL
jgi:hypothetical protein